MAQIEVDRELSRASTPALGYTQDHPRKFVCVTSYGVKNADEAMMLRSMKNELEYIAHQRNSHNADTCSISTRTNTRQTRDMKPQSSEQVGTEDYILPGGSRWIGLVIGKQGQTVKSIERESGTKISFCEGTNKCMIRGTASARKLAVVRIEQIVSRSSSLSQQRVEQPDTKDADDTPHKTINGRWRLLWSLA